LGSLLSPVPFHTIYDGEGKRIKKVTDLETVVYVYSSSKLIAEYSSATPPANPTTNYTATDLLGSPRVITNSSGTVTSRRDFMPFGEELFADGQNRTVGDHYSQSGQDSVRKRFTGYEKDMETGFDFAEARMYDNRYGRFTAVDPLLASGKSSTPQTFNRFVYAVNRPLALRDPTGLQAGKTREEQPPERVLGPIYVDSTGNHFSTAKDDFYSTPFHGSTIATAMGRNYLITEKGAVRIEIPPPPAIVGCCVSNLPNGSLSNVVTILKAAAEIISAYDAAHRFANDPANQFAINASIIGAPLSMEANLAREAGLADDVLLIERTTVIQEALDPVAQMHRTTAVLGTREGLNIVASSERNLSPLQKSMLQANEIAASGTGHAEITAINAANHGINTDQNRC
jgi:RHS repeat-associated protein